MTEIGDNVKGFRKAFGMVQDQLAARSGVAQPTISEIEKGKRIPQLETVRKLAAALGIPISALIESAPPEPPEPPKTPRTDEEARAFDKRFASTGVLEAAELKSELGDEFTTLQEYIKGLRAAGIGDDAFQMRRARARFRQSQERLSAIQFRELDLALPDGPEPKATVAEYIPSASETAETLRMLIGDGSGERSAS